MGGFMVKETLSSSSKSILGPMILLLLLSFINLLFHVFFFGFVNGQIEELTSISFFSILFSLELILNFIILGIIPYGFLNQKRGSYYTIVGFFTFSLIYNLSSVLYYQENILIYYLLFTASLVALMYLLMSHVISIFIPLETSKDEIEDLEPEFLQIGDYILNKQQIKMRNDTMQTLYYFSKGSSEKGTPCTKPKQYEISYNKRTNVPYLKKKKSTEKK